MSKPPRGHEQWKDPPSLTSTLFPSSASSEHVDWNDVSRGGVGQFMLFRANRAMMKFSVILFYDTIGRRCQVCDGIVHRLHPD